MKEAFEAAHKHLDLTETQDAWNRPVYKHSHVQAMWEGWQAALSSAPSVASGQKLTGAARDVLAERERQVTAEGWTPQHDDAHEVGEMARAASQYALHALPPFRKGVVPAFWPWDESWWKPTTPRRDLVKAGALILAEIERLDRASRATASDKEGA